MVKVRHHNYSHCYCLLLTLAFNFARRKWLLKSDVVVCIYVITSVCGFVACIVGFAASYYDYTGYGRIFWCLCAIFTDEDVVLVLV